MGVLYLTDKNNKWYSMNEAVVSKISIKKYLFKLFVKIEMFQRAIQTN